MNIMEHIRSRVKVNEETGCWEWQLSINKYGYGKIKFKRKDCTVHRVAYFACNPEADKSLCVLHRCDNRRCCNPDHLFLGTNADNSMDMVLKGRQSRTQKWTILTAENVHAIRRLISQGLSYPAIASRFNITRHTIADIKLGRTWGHLLEESAIGINPPPPPARRAMAQSSNQTGLNVAGVHVSLDSRLTGNGVSQPEGVITYGPAKPAKPVESPKIDKPRKRKVTLE